ncbi:hypothetical protein QFZ27_002155 [Inquilinus ginsengisoli]
MVDGVDAGAAVQHVRTGPAAEHVVAEAAIELIAAVVPDQAVTAGAAVEPGARHRADQAVGEVAANNGFDIDADGIALGVAANPGSADFGKDPGGASRIVDGVNPGAADQGVRPGPADQDIIAAHPVQRVGTAQAVDRIGGLGAVEVVGVVVAIDAGHGSSPFEMWLSSAPPIERRVVAHPRLGAPMRAVCLAVGRRYRTKSEATRLTTPVSWMWKSELPSPLTSPAMVVTPGAVKA